MSTPYRKGRQLEYWLVTRLQKAGIFAMRAPGSRAFMKPEYLYCDVIAIYHGKIFLFECIRRKRLQDLRIRLRTLCRLVKLAEVTHGDPWICAKVDELREVRFIHALALEFECTDEDTYVKIDEETFRLGLTLEGMIKLIKNLQIDNANNIS